MFRYLPSAPRCKVCHNPFGGFGGKLVGLFGFSRSRKNPNLCTNCCDTLPPGGAVMALFIPGICGPEYHRRAAEAALALLRAVGYGRSAPPWMPIGVGVNSGL